MLNLLLFHIVWFYCLLLNAMSKTKVRSRSKTPVDYDRNVHRFSSPLSELYQSYLVAQKYRNVREQLETRRSGLPELKSEQNEILKEFERNRCILYNDQCNVQHLYEQNQNKLNRTFAKLRIETTKLEELTRNYKSVVKGMCSLVNVAKIMDEFLLKSMVYKNFVDDAAKATKQFDTFSDIINKYNSLMSVFGKNKNAFDGMMESLLTTRAEIVRKSTTMEDELGKLMSKLSRAAKQLEVEAKRTAAVERKLEDLQRAGFANETEAVRINLYRANLLEALIASRAVDESILREPFEVQIDIIGDKFKMLSSIAKSLNP